MIKRSESVRDIFNLRFSKKPRIKYKFRTKQTGYRDMGIMRTLDNYGLNGKKCLDIGAGTGRWLQYMESKNAAFLGAIDISDESLDRCAPICQKVQLADIESDFFDVVLATEVIEHIFNPQQFISEILRVIKNNGLILMSTPNVVSFISRIRMVLGFLPPVIGQDETHVRFYRQTDLIRLFSSFGLRPEFIPTSISLNLRRPHSPFRIPCSKFTSGLADSLLFSIKVKK